VIVKDAICFRNTSGRSSPRRRRTRRSRSHARWAGRAAARPQSKLRCGGGERATFGLGSPRKYGCDQTVCSGLSVVEQPTSLIGALNSPHDKSADERRSLETKPISRGTESSNPVPSSGESCANQIPSIRMAKTCRAGSSSPDHSAISCWTARRSKASANSVAHILSCSVISGSIAVFSKSRHRLASSKR
jgi:hypothetical protein